MITRRVKNSMSSSNELNRFKSEINLTEYAAKQGYVLDKKESSSNSIVMRQPASNDKIIVSKGHDGHWQYFSVRDRADNGSIIDFVQNKTSKSLGEVRRELRPWLAGNVERPVIGTFRQDVEVVAPDREKVIEALNKSREATHSPYLNSRGITNDTLNSPRFKGQILIDGKNNMIFPHRDREGVSGFAVKNQDFTGFSKHGVKRVWHSNTMSTDNKLVLTESAIDAISYQQLHGDKNTRYMSIEGQYSPEQKELLKAAMNKMPQGSTIVMGFDNDKDGARFVKELKEIAPAHVKAVREIPKIGKDWNEQLKNVARSMTKGLEQGLKAFRR